MQIDAGKLDRKLTIQSPTKSKNISGQVIETFVTVATVWGERLELRTVDVAAIGTDQRQATARYLIRYRRGLSVGQRVTVDGQAYRITVIDEPDRRATLILTVAS